MEDNLIRLLKIKDLRLICAIAESGQLGKAADMIAATQPAASRMLSEIENIVGAPLFERSTKGMTLTMIGSAVKHRAENVLLDLRDLKREVEELKHGDRGKVSVGAITSAAVGFVIPAMRKIKAATPEAEIHINVENSPALIRDLIHGRNDFVLARLQADMDTSEFDIQPACNESIQLVVREDHPLTRATEVSIQDLATFEWVFQTQSTPLYEAVNTAFIAAGIHAPTNVTSTTSLLAQIAILASSFAIAPLPSEASQLLIGREIGARLKVLPLREHIIMSPYYLLRLKERQLTPLANRLKTLVVDELNSKISDK